MEIQNLVVARYVDGRVLKGTTRDFAPNRPSFHVEVGSTREVIEVRTKQLKAAFFVKSFEGDPQRDDVRGFLEAPQEVSQGRKIAVRFKDGEFVCGYTMSWSPDREGFFMFPADPGSNNDRIYVITSSTVEVKAGLQAEALAQRMLAADAARGAAAPATGPGNAVTPRPSAIAPRPSGVFPRPSGVMPRPSTAMPRPSGVMPRPSSIGPRPQGLPPNPPDDKR